MEITLDKRAFYVIGAVIGICLLYLLYLVGSFLMGGVGAIFDKKPANSTQGPITLESICAQKSALIMYEQNPKSTHPNVIKLRKDIETYGKNATFTGCPG